MDHDAMLRLVGVHDFLMVYFVACSTILNHMLGLIGSASIIEPRKTCRTTNMRELKVHMRYLQ